MATSSNLENLAKIGQLKAESPAQSEIDGLIASGSKHSARSSRPPLEHGKEGAELHSDGKSWSVPVFEITEMKGPARGRGLGARLSGRRLAGRLLHPRGRDRGEPAGKKGQVSRQVAGNPTAAAAGAAARAGSLLM